MEKLFPQLSEQIELLRYQYHVPGINIAVTLGREVIFTQAFGLANIETQAPLAFDAVLPIGSITKVFIATLLMKLVEQDLVRLDDPLVKYVPEYPHAGTTLLQLACHTSGLPRDAGINYPMTHSIGTWVNSQGQAPLEWYVSIDELLAYLPQIALEIPPDSGKLYSNLGLCLLGIALERAVGQKMPQLITERVFLPLGMNDSVLVFSHKELNPELRQRMPAGYVFTDQGCLRAPAWELGCAGYSGGIVSTAHDLAQFLAFHLDPQLSDRVLSVPSVLRMRPEQSSGDAYIGWWKGWYGGYENFGHAGAHLGYMATALGIPERKLGVVTLTNMYNPVRFEEHSTEIARKLLEILAPQVSVPPRAPFDPLNMGLSDYPGRYALQGGIIPLQVDAVDGKLILTWLDQSYPPEAFLPIGPDQFSPSSSPVPIPLLMFSRDGQGRVVKVNHISFTFNRSE